MCNDDAASGRTAVLNLMHDCCFAFHGPGPVQPQRGSFFLECNEQRRREGSIHVGNLLRESVLFYLDASLDERMLYRLPACLPSSKRLLSFTALLPKQQFRVTLTKLLLFMLL